MLSRAACEKISLVIHDKIHILSKHWYHRIILRCWSCEKKWLRPSHGRNEVGFKISKSHTFLVPSISYWNSPKKTTLNSNAFSLFDTYGLLTQLLPAMKHNHASPDDSLQSFKRILEERTEAKHRDRERQTDRDNQNVQIPQYLRRGIF